MVAQCTCTQGGVSSQALVRWGGALLELAHYKQGQESTDMIQQVSNTHLSSMLHACTVVMWVPTPTLWPLCLMREVSSHD